ncbi:hypothetical protein TNCV_4052251 [Trichonephila clavipes]|nr:hypothetical protein TNCV_4052251 [Trichonephila clavipes]
MEVAVFSFGEASCLVVVQTFTSSTQVQSTGPVIVTRFFFHMCVFLKALWVCSPVSWTTMHHVITVADEQLLESRRLAARTLPPVTIRELRSALQDEWTAMPQQLIETLILSMGRRCETCLAVRGDHILYLRPDVFCWTSITGMFRPSVALRSMLLFQTSFFLSL